jgi:hypothetical protein
MPELGAKAEAGLDNERLCGTFVDRDRAVPEHELIAAMCAGNRVLSRYRQYVSKRQLSSGADSTYLRRIVHISAGAKGVGEEQLTKT